MSKENKNKMVNCADHAVNISKRFQSLYDKQELLDIDLIAGIDKVKVQAHRIVLSASSDYFHAMFSSTFNEGAANEVMLENIDGKTLKTLVDFLYTGCIEFNSETVIRVLKAADFYQVNLLIGAGCDFLADELEPSNCLGIAFFAEQYNYEKLYDQAITYAYEQLSSLLTENEFLQLGEQNLVKLLFSCNDFVNYPGLLFDGVLAWVEHDKANRKKFTYSLMSHVRFTLLNAEFIIENSKALCNSPECYELMRKWLEWHLCLETRSKISIDEKDGDKIIFITGTSDFRIQIFDPELNQWEYTEWPSPLYKRVDYSTNVINGKLIIAGGKIGGRITKIVECLDLQTLEWSEMPPMTLARCWPGLAELNGHLYVVGGKTGLNWSCSVEIFDFSLQAWIYAEPLQISLSSIQVAVLNENLYAVGNSSDSLWRYDPITCKWTITVAKKNADSVNFGIAAVEGFMYAVGGERCRAKSETVECYDPVNKSWKEITPLEFGRLHVKCSVFRNRLIACVGYDDDGEWLNLVDMYDPETQKWTKLASLLPHEFSTSCCLITM